MNGFDDNLDGVTSRSDAKRASILRHISAGALIR
jgi:hypothetical protein